MEEFVLLPVVSFRFKNRPIAFNNSSTKRIGLAHARTLIQSSQERGTWFLENRNKKKYQWTHKADKTPIYNVFFITTLTMPKLSAKEPNPNLELYRTNKWSNNGPDTPSSSHWLLCGPTRNSELSTETAERAFSISIQTNVVSASVWGKARPDPWKRSEHKSNPPFGVQNSPHWLQLANSDRLIPCCK